MAPQGAGQSARMRTEDWQRVQTLCKEAIQRPRSDQSAFLDQACGADTAVRNEVEKLLSYQTQAETFIETSALDIVAQRYAHQPAAERPRLDLAGKHVSHYRILECIGDSGLRSVYEAE